MSHSALETSDIFEFLGDTAAIVAAQAPVLRPPPRLTLSEWAERHFYLSAESSAVPGPWECIPYQRALMDAITDPRIWMVSVMKSARVGYTKMLDAALGYHIHQFPRSMLVVQPTVDGAKTFSKEEIAPMLRDCPELAKLVFEDMEEEGPKGSGNTMLHKSFPGGVLSMVGANSGAGFRSISRGLVAFDEVDAYPVSAGSDGDPIKLGIRRSEYFHDRKIIAGSTPLLAGISRIESLFMQGDQRRYFVPCPHCGHMDFLVFSEREGGGHWLAFEDKAPEDAHFVCSKNGCVIEHAHKRQMVERGEWRATNPEASPDMNGRTHASFHIWAAYSYSPNASWAYLAAEFLEAKESPERLKTFVNTVLGETWKEKGDAPDWERLYMRREHYAIGTVPEGVRFLTAGVDVQKDRVVYEVVGWGAGKESWSVDSGVIPFDTSNAAEWIKVDELLGREYPTASGGTLGIKCLAVDSGFNTQTVYGWARRFPMSRVIAVKGVKSNRTIIGHPSPVDVKVSGRTATKGYKVWPVGPDVAKSELYGWLGMPMPLDGAPFPPGYCHFPEYGHDYFKQLTGEQLVTNTNRAGYRVQSWEGVPGRENHMLDARVYARAAASLHGLDRLAAAQQPKPPARTVTVDATAVAVTSPTPAPVSAPLSAPTKTTPVRADSRFQQRPGWLRRKR